MRVEEFSAGYYKTNLETMQYAQGPSIESDTYDMLLSNIYQGTGEYPTMKLGLGAGRTFQPSSESAIPKDIVALPESYNTSDRNIFLVKPDAVNTLMYE